MTRKGDSETVSEPFRSNERVERRQFVRIRLDADVRYAKTATPEAEQNPAWNMASLRDVSGGGARLMTREKLAVKEKVVLELPIDGKHLHLRGSVKRVQAVSAEASKFDVGIEFVDIHESDRNKIVSLVFRLQLKMQSQKAQTLI